LQRRRPDHLFRQQLWLTKVRKRLTETGRWQGLWINRQSLKKQQRQQRKGG
jgi:hypothetical protein